MRPIADPTVPTVVDWASLERDYLKELEGKPVEDFRKLYEQEWTLPPEDIHRRAAAEMFNVPYDDVTVEQRRRAKARNFGAHYGITTNAK